MKKVLPFKFINKIGRLSFRVWKLFTPSLSDCYQAFDTRMFLKNEMDPKFPWKKYVNKKNTYFKKWGFNVSQLDAEYYSRVSGIKADHYVTRSMAVHFIYPYLDRYDFVPAYMDKNVQKSLLGLPDKSIEVEMPENIITNSNGVFFDGLGRECTERQALDILVEYNKDTILKPTVETYGGHGIIKVSGETTKDEYYQLFQKYRYNFTFQKLVEQHPILAEYNPTSVNTIRIVTYRDFQKRRKVLYACLRFGGEGSVMDNVCSGGGYTGVDVQTGKLIDRKRYTYYQMDVPKISDTMPNDIPCWDKIKEAAMQLHSRLPHLNIVGWDFALSPDEKPILIEFNPRPGVGLQQAVGPMFNIKDLDEIMQHVSQVKYDYYPYGKLAFEDFPERKTVHVRFGS